jgi:hypothetical protein
MMSIILYNIRLNNIQINTYDTLSAYLLIVVDLCFNERSFGLYSGIVNLLLINIYYDIVLEKGPMV